MIALVVSKLSSDLSGLELTEMDAPVRALDHVLIRVRAASLNFPDLLMSEGLYQLKPPLPFVLGLEFAGEVLVAPAGSGLVAGDHVYGGRQTARDYFRHPAAANPCHGA